MNQSLQKLLSDIISLYRGKNLLWQIIFVVLTFVILKSGLDWYYFLAIHDTVIRPFLWSAGLVGFLVPVVAPLTVFTIGTLQKDAYLRQTAWIIAAAEVLGLLVSSFYKVFTGRIPPPYGHQVITDISNGFQFGFLEGGAFNGWPSSHTTIAFAMAFAVITRYPRKKALAALVLFYAFYIAIGVSGGIHWLSEVVAGVILGTIIGKVVAKSK